MSVPARPGVHVRRLALRLDDAAAEGPATRVIEEALRLACDDRAGSLVLLRRLDLGRIDPWQPRAVDVVARRIARLLDGHLRDAAGRGWSASADMAVFETPETARAALAATLLAGGDDGAWFWRSAVPEWQGAAGEPRLARVLSAAWADAPGRVALARALVRAAGLPAPLAVAVPVAPGAWGVGEALAEALLARWPGRAVPARTGPATTPQPQAVQVLMRLMQAIAREPARASAPESLPTPMSVALPPPSVGEPGVGAAGDTGAHPSRRVGHRPAGVWSGPPTGPATASSGEPVRPAAAGRPLAVAARLGVPPGIDPAPDLPDGILAERAEEAVSAAAGLFLLVRPLQRLGFAERTGAEQGNGVGWVLLRHIAERQRVDPADALWTVLGDPADDAGALLQADLRAWRVGLDRFLRRRCGLGLARVVRRRGRISRGDLALRVRFSLAQADVRLRRQAVDVDPGFVPWLGVRLSYLYADAPRP